MGAPGRNGRFWDNDGVYGFAESVKDFQDIAFFSPCGVGHSIDKSGDVSFFKVVLGEVLV